MLCVPLPESQDKTRNRRAPAKGVPGANHGTALALAEKEKGGPHGRERPSSGLSTASDRACQGFVSVSLRGRTKRKRQEQSQGTRGKEGELEAN